MGGRGWFLMKGEGKRDILIKYMFGSKDGGWGGRGFQFKMCLVHKGKGSNLIFGYILQGWKHHVLFFMD